jgi:hypothetical protein
MKKLSGMAAAAFLVSAVLLAGSMYSSYALPSVNLSGKHNVARQSIDNEGKASIDLVKLFVKNKKKDNADLTVQLVKDGQVMATATVSAADLSKKVTEITADFGGAEVTGDYDIVVTAESGARVLMLKEKSDIGGGFYANGRDTKFNMLYELVAKSDNSGDDEAQPEPAGEGTITAYAYRIPSEHWGPTFTGANAQMYFVLYDSTGDIVRTGFADINGYAITGLDPGEQYYIYPTDCNSCHGDDHDVAFRYWEDGSTDRPRPVTAGASVGAYYEYVP